MVSMKTKKICSCIGGILYQLSLGTCFPYGVLGVYIISYIKEYDPSITIHYSYFIFPIFTLCISLFAALGGIIDTKFGCHITLVIGASLITLGSFLIFLVNNIFLCYFNMLILGAGAGISILSATKNLCLYSPNKKGIIGAGLLSCGIFFGAFCSLIAESIINPTNAIASNEGFFDPKIAFNYKKYCICQMIIVPCSTGLSLLFIYQYNAQNASDESTEQEEQIIDPPTNDPLNEDSNQSQIANKPKKEKFIDKVEEVLENDIGTYTSIELNQSELMIQEQMKYKQDLSKVIYNGRIWNLSFLVFFSSSLFFLVTNTFKTLGTIKQIDINIMKFTSLGGGIIPCIFGPIWGVLSDKLSLKPLIRTINICGVILSALMILSIKNNNLFASVVLLNSLFMSGVINTVNPYIMKIFSLKYCMVLCGLVSLFNGLSNILGSIFAFIVALIYDKETDAAYFFVYLIGGVFHLISFGLSFFESGIPFEYDSFEIGKISLQSESNEDKNE